MHARIYAVKEVERMLPLVEVIVAEAVEAVREVRQVTDALRAKGGNAPLHADDLPATALRRLADLRRCTTELEGLGGYLREPDDGTVEWYGELAGEIVFLSWRPGDRRIRHWRSLYSRPSDRRPLPAAAAAGAGR